MIFDIQFSSIQIHLFCNGESMCAEVKFHYPINEPLNPAYSSILFIPQAVHVEIKAMQTNCKINTINQYAYYADNIYVDMKLSLFVGAWLID